MPGLEATAIYERTPVIQNSPPAPTAQAASIAEYFDESFNPYKYTNLKQSYIMQEDALFQEYEKAYKTNPFAHLLVESTVNTIIGDGFHFEGSGAKKLEKLIEVDDTDTKLVELLRETIKKGNGMMDFGGRSSGGVVATRLLDISYITCQINVDITSKDYGIRTYQQGGNILKPDKIFHMMFYPVTGEAYGRSILRSNLIFLQALYDCGGDTFAALKRTAYAPVVAKLDLDMYRTAADKLVVMNNFIDKLKNIESATNNFVIDKRNDLTLLGTGASGARLMPTEQMIAPWMSVVLLNFGFPLGIFMQQGANKAIVQEQIKFSRGMFNFLRSSFKRQVEKNIIAKVTNNCELVWNKAPLYDEETREEMKLFLTAFEDGLISKEYIQDHFDITDTGTTFFQPPTPIGGNKPSADTTSNKTNGA
jgi:hypothetical protein